MLGICRVLLGIRCSCFAFAPSIMASLKKLKSNVALALANQKVFVHCLSCVSFDIPMALVTVPIDAGFFPCKAKEQQRRNQNQNKWTSVGDAMDKAGRSQHITEYIDWLCNDV